MLKALIFDVDGTLADTEDAHREAFNAAFDDAGLGWQWSAALYAGLLDIAGGKERIHHYWKQVDPHGAAASSAGATIDVIHAKKTGHYDARVGAGQLPLRPGILRLIREAQAAQLPMAIATTTTPANVDALLRTPLGADWRGLFVAVCDASTVTIKKPAPDVYHAALRALALPGAACLAFEDSENGLRAASGAGIPTLITPTVYTRQHQFGGALRQLAHLGDPDDLIEPAIAGTDQHWVDVAVLRRWHACTHSTEH